MLSRAVDWHFLPEHPLRSVKRAKGGDDSRVRYLTTDEGRALRTALAAREAQRALARALTRVVHGDDALARAERATAVLFGARLADAHPDDVLTVFDDVPSIDVPRTTLEAGLAAADLAVQSGLTTSKGEANRLIKQGGFYVNDRRLTEGDARVVVSDLIGDRVLVLRKGQRERRVVRVNG